MPVLVALLTLLTQLGLWALADLAARYAANHALQTTRVAGGTATAGHQDATAMLHHLGGRFVNDATITVTRTPTTTTVTIHAHARTLLPPQLLPSRPAVTVTVQAPTERTTP